MPKRKDQEKTTFYQPLLMALCNRHFPVLSRRLTSTLCLTRVVAMLSCLVLRAKSKGRSPLLSTSFNLSTSCKKIIDELNKPLSNINMHNNMLMNKYKTIFNFFYTGFLIIRHHKTHVQ